MLMLSLLGLSSCAHKGAVVLDSYCQDYTPVVQKPGDEKIQAPSIVKKRILGNELKYEDKGCK
jgi:hypothetical protein